MLNYVLGATSISTKDNLLSLLGFIPDALVYVYLGTTIKNIEDITKSFSLSSDNLVEIISLIVGILFTIVGGYYITKYAK